MLALQVRCRQAGDAVAEADGERPGIDVVEADFAAGGAFGAGEGGELAGEIVVVAFDVELKVQPQASRISEALFA